MEKSALSKQVLQSLRKIDELKGQWIGGARLNPQALGRLKRSVLVTSSGASTRIEGSRLSDQAVEKLMSGLAMQKSTDRDAQEVRGYYELLENIFNAWRHISFSENTIKHLHKELLKYVGKDERHRGEYKQHENSVEMFDDSGRSLGVIFETTPAYLTPKSMEELIVNTKKSLSDEAEHPLLVISRFIVEFLAIHPFEDGNGRLSRILTNLLMLQAGYLYVAYASHEKLIEDNKTEYYINLRRSQTTLRTKHENIEPWTQFFLEVSLAQARTAIKLLSHENIEKLLSPKQLLIWQFIATQGEVSTGEIIQATQITRPTVSQGLLVLLRLKKIERIGQGRTTRYKKVL